MPPAASRCSDPLPSAGALVTVREVTARKAVTLAPLASATPLLPTLCPRGSGALSSNRSFQSHPGAARGHVSARGPLWVLPPRLSGHVGSGAAPGEWEKHRVRQQLAVLIFYFDSRSIN